MKKVLIDFDFDSYKNAILSGHLLAPTLTGSLVSGTMDYQNTAVIMNLPNGTTAQSPSTVIQSNVLMSGHTTAVDPHTKYLIDRPANSTRNIIKIDGATTTGLSLVGLDGGVSVNMQEWYPDNNLGSVFAYVDPSGAFHGVGLGAQNERVVDVAQPILSGDATNLNYVTVQDLTAIAVSTAYTDSQILILAITAASTYQPLNALLTSFSSAYHVGNKLFVTTGPNAVESRDFSNLAIQLCSGTVPQQMRSVLELDYGVISGTVARGNHQHPIWFDDFNRYRTSSTEWQEGANGTGSAYFQSSPPTTSNLAGDSGDGYARFTCGSASASTDNVYWRPANELQFNDSFNGTGKRHLWRSLLTNDTNVKGSFGVMGNSSAPSGVRPAASFAFVFDSANANVRFQHDDNQGNTSDADTGVTLSTATAFNWYEISLVSGNVTAYINGVEVASVTSNHPQGLERSMYPFFWIEGNGAAWRSIYCDIYGFWGDQSRIDDGIYT